MEELGKQYYKIKDVAEILGVTPVTIRYWEREFPDIAPMRASSGIRLYTASDIETLRIIHYLLKIRGLKMDAARVQMQVNRKNLSSKVKVMGQLIEVRDELQQMLKTLTKRR